MSKNETNMCLVVMDETSIQEALGSNPSTRYWMDIFSR